MRGRAASVGAALLAGACVPAAPPAPPPAPASSAPAATTAPIPGPPLAPATLEGRYEQGGWIGGRAPFDTVTATIDGEPLAFDPASRQFFAGIDRDAGAEAVLLFTARDGQTRTQRVPIAPRVWRIERVDTPRSTGGSSDMAIRGPELARITAARAQATGAQGWRQRFAWPVRGRISGLFGAQRIYRGGEAGSYHSGIDIAPGEGVSYSAPADGVVVLAAERPFSLEGYLLIVDHGGGLSSAFLHSRRLLVREGDAVRQGQPLGEVGMSGRATGPHLHWGLVWRGRRLDPLLVAGPIG